MIDYSGERGLYMDKDIIANRMKYSLGNHLISMLLPIKVVLGFRLQGKQGRLQITSRTGWLKWARSHCSVEWTEYEG